MELNFSETHIVTSLHNPGQNDALAHAQAMLIIGGGVLPKHERLNLLSLKKGLRQYKSSEAANDTLRLINQLLAVHHAHTKKTIH